MPEQDAQLAVFFDYDNQKVDPAAVLEYLKELGRIAIKRAYGDWVRDRAIRQAMSEQDVESIDLPTREPCPRERLHDKSARAGSRICATAWP